MSAGRGIMNQYTTCVACACGAKYERAEVKLPIKDIGLRECDFCGAALEQWHGKIVPVLRLVAPPAKSKSASAA